MKDSKSVSKDKIVKRILLLLPVCMLLWFLVPTIFGIITASYAEKNILLMIEADPAVSKADILFNDWLDSSEFYIKVLFKDGGRLEVCRVNEWGKGNIGIEYIGGYGIGIIDKRGVSMSSATDMHNPEMKFWSAITGLQLKSVMDLVKNYQLIYRYAEACPNSSDYTFENYDSPSFWEMSREEKSKEMEKAHEIMIKTHPSASRATLDGEEYFLLKFERESPY